MIMRRIVVGARSKAWTFARYTHAAAPCRISTSQPCASDARQCLRRFGSSSGVDRAFGFADDLDQLAKARESTIFLKARDMSRAATPKRSGNIAGASNSSPSAPSPGKVDPANQRGRLATRGDPAPRAERTMFFFAARLFFKMTQVTQVTQVTQGKPWFIWCFRYLGAQGEPKGVGAPPKWASPQRRDSPRFRLMAPSRSRFARRHGRGWATAAHAHSRHAARAASAATGSSLIL